MATRPEIKVLSGNSVEILNAIRNQATTNYRNYVPIATPDAESIKAIGAIIMDSPVLRNTFIDVLVNRIAMVRITSKLYENPIAMFKKGIVDFGETIEEVFVELAKPFQFDPEVAETEFMKRELPNVKSAFHVLNYQKFYKVTISNNQLRQAFLSWDGITDLIAKIVEQVYTAANYDEFLVMKYMVALKIVEGRLYPQTYDATGTTPMKELAKAFKRISNKLEFMSDKYNIAGVRTFAKKENQYLLINAEVDADMDVDVLASAFNMNKAEFMGHRVLIDGFGTLDIPRLNELFKDDPNYIELNSTQLTALNSIPAVLIDGDWFMVYDNLLQFDENYNGQGMYWQYFYHTWKTFSVSPFANGAMFLSSAPTVSSITVSPSTATLTAGVTQQFTASVTSSGFAPQQVEWTASDGTNDYPITGSGLLTIPNDTPDGTSITVTAKSTYSGAVTGTATVTVSGSVTTVTVSPATKTLKANQTQQFTAVVAGGASNPSQAVTWSISSTANATIDQITGVVTAKSSVTNNATATVTATSVQNTNVTGTATITFSTAS